jgi:hypothetical protein
MHVLSRFLLSVILLFSFIQCSRMSPTEPQIQEASAISASIKMTEKNYSAASLDSLVLLITGESITPIRRKITFNGTKAMDKLQVPAGKILTVAATGYQDSTAVLYGSNTVTPPPGEEANVQIKLDFLVPTIMLSPPDSVITKDQFIDLYLSARNVIEMATFGCLVHFNPEVLQVVDLGRQDQFLQGNSGSIMQMEFTQDNSEGTVKAVLGIFPASSAVSGSGYVGSIRFKAIKSDTTDISIQVDNRKNSDLGLFDKNANLMYSVGLGSRLYIQTQLP